MVKHAYFSHNKLGVPNILQFKKKKYRIYVVIPNASIKTCFFGDDDFFIPESLMFIL